MPKSRFQKRYAECKKRGTCYSCGKKLSKDYSSSKRPCCDGCREHDNAVARDYKNRMKIAGRCRTCGKEKVDGRAGRCRQCYEQDRNAQHLYGQRLKLQVLTHYSDNLPPFCSCCGESEIILLTLDHVKGGGNAHRREVGFGPAFYRHIVKKMFPSGYQVLCYSCNIGKHRNGGVCPAADAHLHLKFLRNIHPHTKGRILRHDGGEVVFPVPYRAEQPGDEIPLPVSPIPISVRHWPEVPPAPPSAKQRGTAVPLDWPALSFHGVELVVSHNVILVKAPT